MGFYNMESDEEIELGCPLPPSLDGEPLDVIDLDYIREERKRKDDALLNSIADARAEINTSMVTILDHNERLGDLEDRAEELKAQGKLFKQNAKKQHCKFFQDYLWSNMYFFLLAVLIVMLILWTVTASSPGSTSHDVNSDHLNKLD